MITSTLLHSYIVALCNELCNKQNIYIQEHSLERKKITTYNIVLLQQDILDQWKAIVDQQRNASYHMWCYLYSGMQ